jgi:hypothetical protein
MKKTVKKPVKKRAESRDDMVVTTIALEADIHQRLAMAAVEERAAITELVRQAVREWLDRRDRKKKPRGP